MWPWSSYPDISLNDIATPTADLAGSGAGSTPSLSQASTFDYIIVGGGTAGCALASRLSENPEVTVLLLERGPVVNTWASRVPLISSDYRPVTAPAYKWSSVPIRALGGAKLDMMGGKVMGGSSKINAHLYTRSTPGEYNAWSEAGRKGWSWGDVMPYFVKSETSLTHGPSPHRGSHGPWTNQRLEEIYFQNTAQVIEATTSLGIPYVTEANAPDGPAVSCARLDVTIDANSRRQSVFDAFLPEKVVRGRHNLKVCTGAVVTSVDIKNTPNGLQAVGVNVEHDSVTLSAGKYYIKVRQEIVLCCGAIVSPQLLLLSGIGPKVHLRDKGIDVIKDLPGVGSHLDHLAVSVIYRAPKWDTLQNILSNPFIALRELLKYFIAGKGLFLSPNPQIAIFARSELLNDDFCTVADDPSELDGHRSSNIPDIEIMPIPYNASEWEFDLGKDGPFSFLAAILRPKSHGTVRLISVDPRQRPACDLGTLDSDEDYVVMRKALRLSLRIGRQMREQGYPLRDLHVPISEDDADLDKFIRNGARTTYHYSSTCRMAPESDLGVVDDELRVHGIRGLRVADTSIFPTIPAAHLQAPAVMVGEKCADLLKAAHENI